MDTQILYRLAADGLLLLHAAFVGFVVAGLVLIVAGGFCGWRWVRNPWFRVAHLAAIAFVVMQAWLGRICPLTSWEMALRAKAGDAVYHGAFVAHWLDTVLYYDAPAWVFTLAYTVFGVVVALSWFVVPPRRRQ
jgi:hypothetical protein